MTSAVRRLRDWVLDRVADQRALWSELGRLQAEVEAETPPVQASITYYGTLGEMGHEEDRADDWPEADATGERS